MKILYAIQGTGNGHICRAGDIIPFLQNRCEIDILVSGYQSDIALPYKVKYRYRGLSFIFGKKGGIDVWNTYVKANIKQLLAEVKELPVTDYDFVINDFEPVSAWACYLKKVPCVALGHQASLLDKNAPKPTGKNLFGKFILRNYAPASLRFGFHFSKYSKNTFTPVIRREIREAPRIEKGHYTVYLPSYEDKKLVSLLKNIPEVNWQIFSKHAKVLTIDKNTEVYPANNAGFINSMTSSTGVLCGAGFETPAEALYLGKKLMVIPMQNQYEQKCNATALKSMGVPVLKKLKKSVLETISDWVHSEYKIEISYPDVTEKIINMIFEDHVQSIIRKNKWKKDYTLTFPGFKNKGSIEEQSEKIRKKLLKITSVSTLF